MPYRAAKAGQLKARIGTIKIEKHFTTEAQRTQRFLLFSACGAINNKIVFTLCSLCLCGE
jgi:hypothetical protein